MKSFIVKATIVSSIVLGVSVFFLTLQLIDFFGLDKQTYIYTVKYIRYFAFCLPFFLYSMLILKILYIEGFHKTTLRLTILQVGANFIKNSIFLGVFRLGVGGTVAGTLLSFLLQSIIATRCLKRENKFKMSILKLKINLKYTTMMIVYILRNKNPNLTPLYGLD